MPRITPVDWKTLVKVFELYGCLYRRKEGSHHIQHPGAVFSASWRELTPYVSRQGRQSRQKKKVILASCA